jgi:hypothetical protein
MSFEETLGNGKEGCGLTKNGSASFGERREVATSSESARDKKGEHADQNLARGTKEMVGKGRASLR